MRGREREKTGRQDTRMTRGFGYEGCLHRLSYQGSCLTNGWGCPASWPPLLRRSSHTWLLWFLYCQSTPARLCGASAVPKYRCSVPELLIVLFEAQSGGIAPTPSITRFWHLDTQLWLVRIVDHKSNITIYSKLATRPNTKLPNKYITYIYMWGRECNIIACESPAHSQASRMSRSGPFEIGDLRNPLFHYLESKYNARTVSTIYF